MQTPDSIRAHEGDYQPAAWESFSFAELGWWVHLLTARAAHRASPEKRAKDLYDARNYLEMMRAKLDHLDGLSRELEARGR